MLKTSQVAKLLHKTPMTIGRWVDAFSPYLSHTSQNTDATERRFTDEDMRVLALVWQMREQGNEFELITAALASGERAEPITAPVAITTPNSQLALQNQITDLKAELDQERALRLKSDGKVELLKEQLEKLQERLFKREW